MVEIAFRVVDSGPAVEKSEAQLIIEAKQRKHEEEDAEKLRELEEQRRVEREKADEELRRLKEKQVKIIILPISEQDIRDWTLLISIFTFTFIIFTFTELNNLFRLFNLFICFIYIIIYCGKNIIIYWYL